MKHVSRARAAWRTGDAGMTLVELLVSITIFGVLAVIVFATVLSANNTGKANATQNNLNEQARLVLNRITRELRQAKQIDSVGFTGSTITSITFEADFNGNGTIDDSTSDPEVLTYCWDPPNHRIMLTANESTPQPCDNSNALPVIASDVSSFTVTLTSDLWQYDGACGAAADGVVTWQELDCAPLNQGVGNQNGSLDSIELRNVDGVTISTVVLKGSRQQTYQTKVDLRNQA
ncbi:MAG: type II secretion system protein J [Actinomycetes bacterium]